MLGWIGIQLEIQKKTWEFGLAAKFRLSFGNTHSKFCSETFLFRIIFSEFCSETTFFEFCSETTFSNFVQKQYFRILFRNFFYFDQKYILLSNFVRKH
jgi:hypothetical protein